MQGTGDCHYRSLVGFLSFKRHASVTVQMTRENGALYRAVVTKARIGSGKVGDGARAGTLPSAVMANRYRQLVPDRPAFKNFERWFAAIAARPGFKNQVAAVALA